MRCERDILIDFVSGEREAYRPAFGVGDRVRDGCSIAPLGVGTPLFNLVPYTGLTEGGDRPFFRIKFRLDGKTCCGITVFLKNDLATQSMHLVMAAGPLVSPHLKMKFLCSRQNI